MLPKLVEGVTAPAVEATLRAVAATGDRNAAFADASQSFWNSHIELVGDMSRGQSPAARFHRTRIQAP